MNQKNDKGKLLTFLKVTLWIGIIVLAVEIISIFALNQDTKTQPTEEVSVEQEDTKILGEVKEKSEEIVENVQNEEKVETANGEDEIETMEEKVLQMFMITPEALTGYSKVTSAKDVTKQSLYKYPVGEIIYFASNIQTPDQLKTMTQDIQSNAMERSGLPLFLGIDEEGGTVARIGKNPEFQVEQVGDMWDVGMTKDISKATEVGNILGRYLSEYGLNLDFAPDADVLTNSVNQVIGKPSFGSDADMVASMCIAEADAMLEQGVLPCVKYFPGHGATEGDTHKGFAYTNQSLKELFEDELVPFQAAVVHKLPFLMVSHISVPTVIGDDTPSSLSKVMIQDI